MRDKSEHLENIISYKNSVCTSMKVVFVDIVKYSQRRTKNQVNLIGLFTKLIQKSIGDTAKYYYEQLSKSRLVLEKDTILLPTGDGIAIGIPIEWIHDIHIKLAENILTRIQEINGFSLCEKFPTQNWCDCHDFFNVRIGISQGTVILYKDINGNYNIAGNAINMAARVMNFADPNQVMLTEDAYNEYVSLTNSDEYFHEYKDAPIKHGTIHIYQYRNPNIVGLNSDIQQITTDNSEEEIVANVLLDGNANNQVVGISTSPRLLDMISMVPGKYYRLSDNKEISINHYFEVSKHLIEQHVYKEIMGNNPSKFRGDNLPVENVSFIDAIQFCNKLSLREGYEQAYDYVNAKYILNNNVKGYRLLFEEEWEYCLGYDITYIKNNLNSIAWYHKNSDNKTHVVGIDKIPNRYGIFDLIGNVWEWCYDNYTNNLAVKKNADLYYQNDDSMSRVLRGGSFVDYEAQFTTNFFRKKEFEENKNEFTGFRVILQNNKK